MSSTSPNAHLSVSPAGLALIARYEGFSADWYACPAGKQTIGYGHVYRDGDDFDTPISHEFATALLRRDASAAERSVSQLVRVPLTQNQFDALVSLVFNIGAGNFSTSTLLHVLDRGDYQAAADQFLVWRKAGGKVLHGLEQRRQAERAMFLGEAA